MNVLSWTRIFKSELSSQVYDDPDAIAAAKLTWAAILTIAYCAACRIPIYGAPTVCPNWNRSPHRAAGSSVFTYLGLRSCLCTVAGSAPYPGTRSLSHKNRSNGWWQMGRKVGVAGHGIHGIDQRFIEHFEEQVAHGVFFESREHGVGYPMLSAKIVFRAMLGLSIVSWR
ncbi:hypothetical protein KL906_003877 [Ogataea polymorpha]|nr:hypothetical protein KL908_003559 [Ogataea polymorpha]KAG7907796.1 hypothetical protein KL906_003877 [Ogataea polymorpha]KAG7915728.1 hypothetical protein KL927_004004 [Ogataea polymorpha]